MDAAGGRCNTCTRLRSKPFEGSRGWGAAASGLPGTGRRRACFASAARSIAASIRPRDTGRLHSMPLLVLPGVDSQPYLEFNWLVKHARAVITDSGGITEETTVMQVPCLTLRDTTERPETVTVGTNELIGTDPSKLKPALDRLFAGQWKRGGIPPLWDGRTGERIVAALERLLAAA